MASDDWLRLIDRALQHPGTREVLGRAARQILDGRDEYRRSHWGRSGGRRTRLTSVADVSGGIIDLGGLYAITYETQKGADMEPTLYEHTFRRPLPILGYAADGSGLVVARGSSGYDVEARGIVG